MANNKEEQSRLFSESSSEYALTPEEQTFKEEYRQRLLDYLQDPEVRKIPGFPIGDDEAILEFSDPPYYTICPNPFLSEIIEQWQNERLEMREELGLPIDNLENGYRYHREPFSADVSEGKNNPIYNAHSYHTKVPHPAIMRYILHYTDPGDIVFDGFCGTGMAGIAAQFCGDRTEVEKLGYFVGDEGCIYEKPGDEEAFSRLGSRKAILNDLSPAATFIAFNYNAPVDVKTFEREAQRILDKAEEECGWMYETWHPHFDEPNKVIAKINYTVWSEVFLCPLCGEEVVFFDVAVNKGTFRVDKKFRCSACNGELEKRNLERSWQTTFDNNLNVMHKFVKFVPVLINYQLGKQRFEKLPDSFDIKLLNKIVTTQASESKVMSYWLHLILLMSR